jgi:NADH dehydrogenase FAD-containing subunit
MGLDRKRVIIIGGGFAGCKVAKSLDKYASENGSIELILITKRENFLLNKFAALRAATLAGTW